MQSPEIVLAAVVVISIGAAVLYYQHTGTRRFEGLIAFCGVALVTCGLAMGRDGIEGSRRFLWMFPPQAAPLASPRATGHFAANAPAPRPTSLPK
jgi:hypothetical protein